ncbi:MAG: DUF1353 domain-containing protein [Lysobacter sp.]
MDEPYSDRLEADKWMREVKSRGAVSDALNTQRFADGYYALVKSIGWSPNPGQETLPPVRVPVGFVTDFASIPRPFWSLIPRDGQYTFAAIIHDFLYWDQSMPREQADLVFKYAMQDFKVPAATISIIHKAVRVGGGGAWKGNATAKQSGEKRRLTQLPDDPLVTWADWKKKPGVFD